MEWWKKFKKCLSCWPTTRAHASGNNGASLPAQTNNEIALKEPQQPEPEVNVENGSLANGQLAGEQSPSDDLKF